MTKRLLVLMMLGGMLVAGMKVAPRASAMSLPQVISTIAESGGRYVRGGASLAGSDCSGLVSVAMSLALGEPIHRYGNTGTILAGNWPHMVPGASPDDVFIVAANRGHMFAQIDGVGIEATTSGRPFAIGPAAKSVWDSRYQRWHVDPAVLVLA